MADKGYIKLNHDLSFTRVNPDGMPEEDKEKIRDLEYSPFTLFDRNITIGDKVVSYELLYAMINRRFHKCMYHESHNKARIEEYMNMDDHELVH